MSLYQGFRHSVCTVAPGILPRILPFVQAHAVFEFDLLDRLSRFPYRREVLAGDVKVELETYARQVGERIVKPFMLVIARDTTHAAGLMQLIRSSAFFEGRYAEKVIQVDSSVKEEETIEHLLKVEQSEEPTEIVIHVNMLKEGWDVTNLYTIVPLRAANARTLIEQSIGRGLRLPYGKRTGVTGSTSSRMIGSGRSMLPSNGAAERRITPRVTTANLGPTYSSLTMPSLRI